MTLKEFKRLEASLMAYRDQFLKPGPKRCMPCYHHEGSHRRHRTYQRSVCTTIDDVIHLLADNVKRKP